MTGKDRTMIIQSIAGLLVFVGLAWLMSENRKQPE